MSGNRVSREMVRVFFAQNQHIAIVMGKKPRSCNEIELVEVGQNPKVPIFVVQCSCEGSNHHGCNQRPDSYCLVQPIFPGPKRPYLTLLHRDGSDLVKVEAISSPIIDDSTSAIGRDAEIEDPEHLSGIASAIGFSQNFSLDEAFKDALHNLRARPLADPNQELSIIDVVSMGAAYGGFSGFSRLFVKIEQSSILNELASRGTPRKKIGSAKHGGDRPKKANLHH